MTPTVFYAACICLWGTTWRVQAIEKLPVSERTLRRWINGDEPVPLGVWAHLQTLLSAKLGEISAIRAAIKLPADPLDCPACEGVGRVRSHGGYIRCEKCNPNIGAPRDEERKP